MYLQRNVLSVENSSERVEQETDIRMILMSTGEDGAHIGTKYSHYNVNAKEMCNFVPLPCHTL